MRTLTVSRPHLHRVLEATPENVAPARHAVAAFAREHGVADQRAADIALVVSEACSNVVVHAYVDAGRPGTFEVEAERRDDRLHVRIADAGRGLTPRPDSPGLGLGMPLMQLLSDACVVSDGRPGTVVELSFGVGQPPG
jgi:serine/threonine-protein kinase RsbW